ncbi:MAG: alanine racemase [Fusobacteriaceae bacterium]|nr:alanine racemase [Fusobacteriaceae bacterium]MBN2838509.1 alanine racemase [Fusobacteriaceae bacterium]
MRTWAEINLDNLNHNINTLKKYAGDRAILGVVKADAYGHGAVDVVKEMSRAGIKIFGVACFDEAKELRVNGIEDEIMIFGCTPPEDWESAVAQKIQLTIASFEEIEQLEKMKIRPEVHIAVDTGMGRIGFEIDEAVEAINYLREKKLAEIVGIYTHLSSADLDFEDEYTKEQLSKFSIFEKMDIKYRHILNSAGTLNYNDNTSSNVVRGGIILYGILPCDGNYEEFKPVMKVKSKILFMKKIKEPKFISYQKKYLAQEGELIATIPIGYADGLDRRFTNKGKVLIKGNECQIVGVVCMDQIMVKIPLELQETIKLGDEVEIFWENYNEKAKEIGTISYEIVTSISTRVERVYIKDNKVVGRRGLLGRE